MTEQKKQPRKNPSPLVVQGTFYVTATFEDKQYVVSNGLSFLRFAKDDDDIKKGDYVSIHGPVYQKKDASHPIVTGEAIVKKLTEKEVEEYKAKLDKAFKDKDKTAAKKASKKKEEPKAEENKMPWE
jgi:hypothetical protein